jgi:hypothetical protein
LISDRLERIDRSIAHDPSNATENEFS